MHSPKRHGRITSQRTLRAQTCRAALHCRTGHRGLKSTTEELGDSELPTGGVPTVEGETLLAHGHHVVMCQGERAVRHFHLRACLTCHILP